jgi:hypothetical protein
MSVSQIIPTFGFMVGTAFFGTSWVLSLVAPSLPPIEVHSIRYHAGTVVQDRTVAPAGNNAVKLLQWSAQVVYASTGRPVPGCTGAGSWPYDRGRMTVQFELPEWTGNAACTPEALPTDVDLRLRGVWAFEGRQVVALSPAFRAGEVGE